MADITGRRMMAEIDGDFVVFLIGAVSTVSACSGRSVTWAAGAA